MKKGLDFIREMKTEGRSLWILYLIVLVITVILNYYDGEIFQRFIGHINPVLSVILCCILALIFLPILRSGKWCNIKNKVSRADGLKIIGLVAAFGCIAISVDYQLPFPEDINILFPASLLFYPGIAFVVEILFHIVPLSILLILSTYFFKNLKSKNYLYLSFLVIALLEPTYQVKFMEGFPCWAMVITWFNLLLFNLTQLNYFRKYGFLAMYSIRLLYYLIWHIVWGGVRLEILF
jgi:hypothetical protein